MHLQRISQQETSKTPLPSGYFTCFPGYSVYRIVSRPPQLGWLSVHHRRRRNWRNLFWLFFLSELWHGQNQLEHRLLEITRTIRPRQRRKTKNKGNMQMQISAKKKVIARSDVLWRSLRSMIGRLPWHHTAPMGAGGVAAAHL